MNECAEAFTSASGGLEATLECAGVALDLGFLFRARVTAALARLTRTRRMVPTMWAALGVRSALILAEGDIQTKVESAFHDPIARGGPIGLV